MDPFMIAPADFTMATLKAVEPFLRIHQQPADLRNSGLDKFEGGKVKPEVLQGVLEFIGPKLTEMERKWEEQRTELNLHPRNLELVSLIQPFTTPTDQEFVLIKDVIPPPIETEQSGYAEYFGGDAFLCEAGTYEDEPSSREEDEPSKLPSSEEDEPSKLPRPRTESDDNYEGMKMDTPQGRTDGRVLIHDKGPLDRPGVSELVKSEISTQRCAIVEEFKKNESNDAVPQTAAYARPEIRRNISNKHYKPMCLLILSKFKFTFAFIKYEGIIRAHGPAVTDSAYKGFCESCKNPGRPSTSLGTLKEMYHLRTKHLRSVCGNQKVCYKAQDYILGDLYVATEWYALPTSKTDTGLVSSGAKKFFEGILRIVVGDTVLRWKYMDMLMARATREVQTLVQTEIGGLNIQRVMEQQRLMSIFCRGLLQMQRDQCSILADMERTRQLYIEENEQRKRLKRA